MYTIVIDHGNVHLQDLSNDDLKEIQSAAMDAEAEFLRSHLESLPGRSFYKEAAASLERDSGADYEAIHITKRGFALQLFGGVVSAGRGKSAVTGRPTEYLTIPANKSITEAAGFYPGLVMMSNDDGDRWLAKPREDEGFDVYFWLVPSVKIKAHPSIMPTLGALSDAARQGAEDYIKALSYLN